MKFKIPIYASMNSMHVFKFQSRVINGGSIFSPEIIEIDDTFVTIKKKRHPFTVLHSFSIPHRNIVNIRIIKSGFGVNILIESFSKSIIFGKGFSASNALAIKKILLG
ncbi:MAG: hypothetical protein FD166_392 [Bacteroidetes bacterium]|nr:MAG: hypothetical protein FD166_392 [Bacteroidota bacterium]